MCTIIRNYSTEKKVFGCGFDNIVYVGMRVGQQAPHDIRLLLRGNRYMDLLNTSAISIYNQAINEFPSIMKSVPYLHGLAKMNGDYNRAITEYKTLISNNPTTCYYITT